MTIDDWEEVPGFKSCPEQSRRVRVSGSRSRSSLATLATLATLAAILNSHPLFEMQVLDPAIGLHGLLPAATPVEAEANHQSPAGGSHRKYNFIGIQVVYSQNREWYKRELSINAQ